MTPGAAAAGSGRRLRIPGVRIAVVLITAAALMAVSALTGSGSPASGTTRPLQGVFAGSAHPSGVAGFALETHTAMTLASDYVPPDTPGTDTWTQAWGPGDLSWMLPVWHSSPYHLVLGVPMIESSASGAPLATLAGGAAGDYDSYFAELARTLVSAGEGSAYLRLGWEFNVNSEYAWSVTNSSTPTDAANFAAFFRNIVTTMRGVAGAEFKFVWNPAPDSWGADIPVSDYWPGNAYVDYIGLDTYDSTYITSCGVPLDNTSTPAESQCAWERDILPGYGGAGQGLDYFAQFAKSHGIPLAIPEWGLDDAPDGHGLGDDPTYMQNFITWMADNDVAWANYFDYSCCLLSQFPKALAVYQRDYGPVSLPSFFISSSTLPNATPGRSYTTQLSAQGGTAPYRWHLVTRDGRLPRGLHLAPDGLVSGTPSLKRAKSGTYHVTVVATSHHTKGHARQSVTRTLTLTVW